jgi:hypothetical protein
MLSAMSVSKPPKVKYRRTKEELKAPVHRKWGRLWDAAAHCGLSRSEIYKILRDPTSGVRSFVYKAGADKRSGCRMIDLESLDAYFDKLSKGTASVGEMQ